MLIFQKSFNELITVETSLLNKHTQQGFIINQVFFKSLNAALSVRMLP